jgi:DNA repair exonuclease SbcCD ATPase subunit
VGAVQTKAHHSELPAHVSLSCKPSLLVPMSAAASPHPRPALESFVEVLPVPPQQERRRGVVRFVGLTDFADGEWVGVEVVGSEGRNDGSVKGQSYFKCLPGQGIFVRPNLVIPYTGSSTEEKDKTPDPVAAKIAELEKQLATAHQQTTEAAEAQRTLKNELHRVQEELARVKAAADDNLAAQVRLEEERLELQKQLDACQKEAHAAQHSACSALEAQAAAESRAKEAVAAQQRSDHAHAQLQKRVIELEKEVAKAQADAATAAAQAEAIRAQFPAASTPAPSPPPPQPSVDPAMKAELEALRDKLQRKEAEMQQLRTVCGDLQKAEGECAQEREAQKARVAAAEERACIAEQRVSDVLREQLESTAVISAAHATALSDLRTEVEALKAEKTDLEARLTAELQAQEGRLRHECETTLREHEEESCKALEAAQHEKSELQELFQLLEDELKEEKAQSDELARLVEQLSVEKASAESAVGTLNQQIVQERDRLRREVEEARAREVRLMTAVEDAQREKEVALQQVCECGQRMGEDNKRSRSTVGASHNVSAMELAEASLASMLKKHNTDVPAALVEELEKCRTALDEAQVRILQLTSTEQVAQELHKRCDELSRAVHEQRLSTQKQLGEAHAGAAAAQSKMMAEVTLWKRQCEAAQRNAADLANTVAELRWQLVTGGTTSAPVPASAGAFECRLDAVRERRYEAQISFLTRQLLELQSTRIMVAPSTWLSCSVDATPPASTSDVSPSLPRSSIAVLDFTTPESCKASTQRLFRPA